MNNIPENDVFAHPQFIRNRPELLSDIRRKSFNSRKTLKHLANESVSLTTEPVKPVTSSLPIHRVVEQDTPAVTRESSPLETLGFVSKIEWQLGSNAAMTEEMQRMYVNKSQC